tara:strand:- start:1065 stop:2159 length:1095 start_codon:yes stop_codon:yes gene_type:complete
MKQISSKIDFNNLIEIPPFSLDKTEKDKLHADFISELTNHHYENCIQYKRILDLLECPPETNPSIEKTPPLPVSLFKDHELLSVSKSQIIKTMISSGTTGQSVSKIFLDRITSTNQTKVLVKIVSSFTGAKRLPMLIIDTKSVIKDRNLFSARGAGILGFSMLGYDVTYALDENMQFDFDTVNQFCSKYKDENILIFGFTFMIWNYFYKKLEESKKQLTLENGIMIHGGGWKKMEEQAVDNKTFKDSFKKLCNLNKIHNYYGMVEQTGSIFMECEHGFLHSSIFSDLSILENDFSILDFHKVGLVQLTSLLPYSYPGHIILSEDIGEISGVDNCRCGRLEKYFKIHGRVPNAEIKGCSDTYETT